MSPFMVIAGFTDVVVSSGRSGHRRTVIGLAVEQPADVEKTNQSYAAYEEIYTEQYNGGQFDRLLQL